MPEPHPEPTIQQQTLKALEEIARWTRFMGLRGARETMGQVLKTEEDRTIYFLSTGASSREIEKVARVSRSTVQKRWAEWQAIGIVRDSARWQGRKEAVFSLQELGLEVPAIASKLKVGETADSETEEGPPVAALPSSKPIEQFNDSSAEKPPTESGSGQGPADSGH
jgi:hypothetical protein